MLQYYRKARAIKSIKIISANFHQVSSFCVYKMCLNEREMKIVPANNDDLQLEYRCFYRNYFLYRQKFHQLASLDRHFFTFLGSQFLSPKLRLLQLRVEKSSSSMFQGHSIDIVSERKIPQRYWVTPENRSLCDILYNATRVSPGMAEVVHCYVY